MLYRSTLQRQKQNECNYVTMYLHINMILHIFTTKNPHTNKNDCHKCLNMTPNCIEVLREIKKITDNSINREKLHCLDAVLSPPPPPPPRPLVLCRPFIHDERGKEKGLHESFRDHVKYNIQFFCFYFHPNCSYSSYFRV